MSFLEKIKNLDLEKKIKSFKTILKKDKAENKNNKTDKENKKTKMNDTDEKSKSNNILELLNSFKNKNKNSSQAIMSLYNELLKIADTDERIELQSIEPTLENIRNFLVNAPDLHERLIKDFYKDFIFIDSLEKFEEEFIINADLSDELKDELERNYLLLATNIKTGKNYLFMFLPVFSFRINIDYDEIGFLSSSIMNFYFKSSFSFDEKFETSNARFEQLLEYIESNNINDFHIRGLDAHRYIFTGRIGQEVIRIGGVKPARLVNTLIFQAKLMMGKDVTTEIPEDTGFIKINIHSKGRLVERSFRVNIIKIDKLLVHTYSVSIRRLMNIKEIEKLGLDGLGYLEEAQKLIRKIQYRKQGLSLVVGKTNSGKSTLLALLLNELYKYKGNQEKRIISIENPVEIVTEYDQIDLSTTANADEDKKMTMERAQKAILRHDPDVVLISEVRSDKDIQDYVKLGLSSGVNAFTTLHAGDVKTAILRLINASDNPLDVITNLNGIIAQNLFSKVCQTCKGTGKINEEVCPECKGLGKKGMVPICEIAYFKKLPPSEFINENNEINFSKFFDFKYLIDKGYLEYISKTEIAKKYLDMGYLTKEDFNLIKESEEEIYKDRKDPIEVNMNNKKPKFVLNEKGEFEEIKEN